MTGEELAAVLPGAKPIAAYTDLLARPERLAAETIADGLRRAPGGAALSRARPVRILAANGRVRGVVVARTGAVWTAEGWTVPPPSEETIETERIVFAAGPWTGAALRALGVAGGPPLRPTRGSHILLPGVSLSFGVLSASPRDGRPMFLLPAPGGALAGTTEADEPDAPRDPVPLPWEVEYLLEFASGLLGETPRPAAAWTGLRPLLSGRDGTVPPGAVSRRDRLEELSPRGAWWVAGGKLTTQRPMARRVVAKVLGRRPVAPEPALPGRFLPPPHACDGVENLLDACDLAPVSLGDLVFRRTWYGLRPTVGPDEVARAASAVAKRLGWDEARTRREVAGALEEGRRTYGRPWPA